LPGGVYIIGGAPAHWRTGVSDANPDPEWRELWTEEFDAISPWTIGRYSDERGADAFAEEKVKGDMAHIKAKNEDWERQGKAKKVDYMPVVFPGGSVSMRASAFILRMLSINSRMFYRATIFPRVNGALTTSKGMADNSFGDRSSTSSTTAFASFMGQCGMSEY
jgi:hypothetical protein